MGEKIGQGNVSNGKFRVGLDGRKGGHSEMKLAETWKFNTSVLFPDHAGTS
jgi:hypothetical protein